MSSKERVTYVRVSRRNVFTATSSSTCRRRKRGRKGKGRKERVVGIQLVRHTSATVRYNPPTSLNGDSKAVQENKEEMKEGREEGKREGGIERRERHSYLSSQA